MDIPTEEGIIEELQRKLKELEERIKKLEGEIIQLSIGKADKYHRHGKEVL